MEYENYNYTYKVNQINMENATFEVEYMPEDSNLSPVRYNLSLIPKYYKEIVDANNNLIYASQDEVPFSIHMENTIDGCKPFNVWRNQYMMIKNIDSIHKANGSFTYDTANNLTVWPTGYTVQIHNTNIEN